MNDGSDRRDRVLELGKLTQQDFRRIRNCRRDYNRLGYAYQTGFVRLENRFPSQRPFEILDDLLTFVSVQTGIASGLIGDYSLRQQTISEHQQQIREHLGLKLWEHADRTGFNAFLFNECCRLEQTAMLKVRAREFLRENSILEPGTTVLEKAIGIQRRQAREHIFQRISKSLSDDTKAKLDALLEVPDGRRSPIRLLKDSPGDPSVPAILRLTDKLGNIANTDALRIGIDWLNNNYQRSLAKHVKKCSAYRIRRLHADHRYASLICFLVQTYQDTVDFLVDMQGKLLYRVCSQAEREVIDAFAKRRQSLQRTVKMLEELGGVALDEEIPDANVRDAIFQRVSRESLAQQIEDGRGISANKALEEFDRIVRRHSYFRKFTPAVLRHLSLQPQEDGEKNAVLDAVNVLLATNENNSRKLPEDTSSDFVPNKIKGAVGDKGSTNKHAWECALLLAIRDEIKAGNITVGDSKRFGKFSRFFIDSKQWTGCRTDFFRRAGLPERGDEAVEFLRDRLGRAFDEFLASQPNNAFATIDESGWHLSVDGAEKLTQQEEAALAKMKTWLAKHMRSIRLPDLLIEVDNDLSFTRNFAVSDSSRTPEEVCSIIATILAHGCNIGPYTLSRLTECVSYSQIKKITDWRLTEDNQRAALADVVKAISSLGTSLAWGEGKTSASDGQRFLFPRRVLQRTFSHRMNDYALEFYSFIADNYAPFFSRPIECTDRDAPYVLDGLLYNESDLDLEEHYTDTHGYTEVNFAAFAMLGRRFCPRIRGVQKQRIYRIDSERDYGSLQPLVEPRDRGINTRIIRDHWDRMGQFYASLETGHATASVALKRLTASSKKNRFYRANRELGRIFKTEFILQYMSQSPLRRRVRKGLLKNELLHTLARDVCFGKRGKISARDLQEQMTTCSCLTLILACIIYWQAKEIERVVRDCDPESNGIDVRMLEHISPIEWENVLLYGEYIIDRQRIRAA